VIVASMMIPERVRRIATLPVVCFRQITPPSIDLVRDPNNKVQSVRRAPIKFDRST
jgi:hypothetical protein